MAMPPGPGLSTASPASLLPTHFGLSAAIPIATRLNDYFVTKLKSLEESEKHETKSGIFGAKFDFFDHVLIPTVLPRHFLRERLHFSARNFICYFEILPKQVLDHDWIIKMIVLIY